ncbi:hypothetical protein [Ruegeria sp. HKCCD8929]|uniref:hypothetical protein n=1 Tax=Ruegeria sp. HKCCD8929 TaxID=2683006 RepID=UPI0014882403|nr:hypothetical protein [Ruegeria sp. HKCCD8929]
MAGEVQFNRDYTNYGAEVRDFERTTDVSIVLTEVLSAFFYPLNALIGNKFSAQWLGEGDKGPNDPEDLDLIFEFSETEVSGAYREIVLRDSAGVATYGGWLIAGGVVNVTDEIVNGYRVIVVRVDEQDIRHENDGSFYQPVSGGPAVTAAAAARRGRISARWD